jgi:DNA-binding GntR family transcriptional regulator
MHRRILDAGRKRSAAAAGEVMCRHLAETRRHIETMADERHGTPGC